MVLNLIKKPPEWEKIQTTNKMVNNLQTLEQLHQLINNEVTGPKFYEFLDKNIPTNYDDSPWINLREYLFQSQNDNVLGLHSEIERDFFMFCIFNDDYNAFLEEMNGSYYGDSDVVLSTEKEWYEYTHNLLNLINKSN